jgi:hypothetical protein
MAVLQSTYVCGWPIFTFHRKFSFSLASAPFVIELALMSLIAPRSFRLYLKILILCFCSSPALSSAKLDRNAVNGTRHQSAYDLANGTQHGFVYDLGAVTQHPELERTSDFFDTSDVAPSSSSMLRKGMCMWCVWSLQGRGVRVCACFASAPLCIVHMCIIVRVTCVSCVRASNLKTWCHCV